jgi:hypothetical protein
MADPKDASESTERSSREGAGDGSRAGEGEAKESEGDERARAFRRFGDNLLTNLIGDSSAALRRGQGLVSGVAQGTKEEVVRMISAEVRGFLDKIDAVELVQDIVSGLVIEMKTEIRFRRADDGKLEPQVDNSEAKVRNEKDKPSDKSD